MKNVLSLSDSYKYSHFLQYPENVTHTFSYLESRSDPSQDVVFFGLQYLLIEYIDSVMSENDIVKVDALCKEHGVPFNKQQWTDLFYDYGCKYLPVRIRALPEGTVTSGKTVLMTIENTDPRYPWLPSFLETLLLKVWYPTTVATRSYAIRKMLEEQVLKTSNDTQGVGFMFHNFGDRGSSSVETAMWGALGHLTQFKGTDNFCALEAAYKYYDADQCVGGSIPASEHSTVTSWGRENEYEMITNFLERYKMTQENPNKCMMIACVLDSYDIYKATDFVTRALKYKIESNEYPTFVIRPDSGDPLEVLPKLYRIMENNQIKSFKNAKGYTVWDKYRIIWGDGVTAETIKAILDQAREEFGLCATNFAFGSGGYLMQDVTRDTLKFAFKCAAAKIDGKWKDVYKDPITDPGKISKRGRYTTIKWLNSGWDDKKFPDRHGYQSIPLSEYNPEKHLDVMETVYENGQITKTYEWQDVLDNGK